MHGATNNTKTTETSQGPTMWEPARHWIKIERERAYVAASRWMTCSVESQVHIGMTTVRNETSHTLRGAGDGIESVSIMRISDKQHTRDDPTRQVSKKRIRQHTKREHMYIQFSKSISSSFPLLNLFWIENTNVVHLVWRTNRYDQHSRSHRAAIEIMGQHPGSQPETWIKWLL